MAVKYTSISVMGDKKYVHAVRGAADEMGMPMGVMVTRALDLVYGDRIRAHLDFFRTRDGDRNHQNADMITSDPHRVQ